MSETIQDGALNRGANLDCPYYGHAGLAPKELYLQRTETCDIPVRDLSPFVVPSSGVTFDSILL